MNRSYFTLIVAAYLSGTNAEAGRVGKIRGTASTSKTSASTSTGAAAFLRRVIPDVDHHIESFARKTVGFRPASVRSLGGKKASVVMAEGRQNDGGELYRIVFRQPSPNKREPSLRRNRALLILATQFGRPDLVPPASAVRFPKNVMGFEANTTVMAMEAVEAPFVSGDKASRRARRKVDGETRLIVAVMDVLSQHRDRKLANILISEEEQKLISEEEQKIEAGAVKLVDPDTSFGQGKTRPAYRSPFFYGGKLGFDNTKYNTFESLPSNVREVIKAIAELSQEEVADVYGLDESESRRMHQGAIAIYQRGLVSAIDEFLAQLAEKGFKQDFDL